jgi:large subunit ribosomal protein L30
MKVLAAIRIRGELHLRPEVRKTLELLRLHRVNHCVLLEDTPSARGMLKQVEAFVAFGEASQAVIERLLEKRGRLSGKRRLTAEYLKSKKISFGDLAKQLAEGKANLEELGIKPVFRLHPPKKGFERQGIKRSFAEGGALGYRADAINDLVARMV